MNQQSFELIRPQAGPIPGRLRINQTCYRFMRIDSPEAVAHVRLEKLNGSGETIDTYDCAIDTDGKPTCSCGDFNFRGEKTGKPCKHLEALTLFGLLPVLAREPAIPITEF